MKDKIKDLDNLIKWIQFKTKYGTMNADKVIPKIEELKRKWVK